MDKKIFQSKVGQTPKASSKATAKQAKKIEKLEKEIRKLQKLAYKDELTKLYNRHGFKGESEKVINQVTAFLKHKDKRKSLIIKNFSLIIFDLDNFKNLNDTYGHQAGDEALKFFSNLVSERVRGIDSVARWGGEEIVVGLTGADEKDACMVAEGIREKLESSHFIYKKKKIKLTVSGGVASLDKTLRQVRRAHRKRSQDEALRLTQDKTGDFEKIFLHADRALYRAKDSGKNNIIKWSDL